MCKPRGPVCNLACSYCYYRSKTDLYPGGSFRMSDAVLEAYVRDYLQSQQAPEVEFAWQGGEPTLMGLDFFRRILKLQRKYRRPGTVVRNVLQTHGLLLDDEWARFFRRNHFLVGVSLDGPAGVHDAFRRDRLGRPTHTGVLDAIRLLQRHRVEFNILCCVHAASAGRPLDVYRFLRDQVGAQFIQFIPVVEADPAAPGGVSDRSVTGEGYGEFLTAVFDEWVRGDVGQVFVQQFDAALAAWMGLPAPLCVHAPTCGLALALEHNGDLYACDHFVDPQHRLGNILEQPLAELVGSAQQIRFGLSKRASLPRQCRECDVLFACSGGCPKDRLHTTADGEAGLNVLCAGYRRFFRHIDAPMRTMAALLRTGRPAADVMQVYRGGWGPRMDAEGR